MTAAAAATLAIGDSPEQLPFEAADRTLIEAIRRGDRRVGKQLYERLSRVVDRTLCRVLGPGAQDLDDLAQTVFEQVILSIKQDKYGRRCSLSSWAAAIACNVGLNSIRSRTNERGVLDRQQCIEDESLRATASPHPERALLARDELRRLRRVLAQMPEGRAQAVLLSDVLGYDLKELAALIGCSVTAAESRLTRGRRELAERLAASDEGGGS